MNPNEITLPGKMLRPHNLKELAAVYGVCYKTLKKWLVPFEAEIGERTGRYFSVNQIRIIVAKLGLPAISDDIKGK